MKIAGTILLDDTKLLLKNLCDKIMISNSIQLICLAFYFFVVNKTELVRCGLLRVGTPLSWQKALPHLQFVRSSGYKQFLIHYNRCKDLETPVFLWGDEIEYGIFERIENHHFDLSLTGAQLRQKLTTIESSNSDLPIGCEWQPEYGSWMVEGVPRNPFGSYASDLLNVEKSMNLRRKRLHFVLSNSQIAPSVSTFPLLGVRLNNSTAAVRGAIANSEYVSDDLINPHPRFGALTQNIRQRRGSNVNISIVGIDEQTIHMDAMAFGMGCCCLQVTMQCRSDEESRYLHDQLAILSPLLQALSAATPVLKGRLTSTDTRWEVISQAVDDRTPAERTAAGANAESWFDDRMAGGGVRPLSKSRYSSVSLFIAKPRSTQDLAALASLNDISADVDDEAYKTLVDGGLDHPLAMHVAHLFVRDPLVIFSDSIEMDNANSMDHFENIQSTNWRSMRWKLPSLRIGLEYARRRAVLQQQRSQDEDGEHNEHSGMPPEDRESSDGDFLDSLHHNILVEDRIRNYQETEASLAAEIEDQLSGPELQSFGPGWRVEFRPLEVQLTDFENAAYAILVVLLSRCLLTLSHRFNVYMPMSFVEENMKRAQLKDAALSQKFWIRKNAISSVVPDKDRYSLEESYSIPDRADVEVEELTLDEIFNGKVSNATLSGREDGGLLGLVGEYLQSIGCDCADDAYQPSEAANHSVAGSSSSVLDGLAPYLNLIRDRAAGTLPTAARWMRNFIEGHAAYRGDGVVSAQINDDLLELCDKIGMGRVSCPSLYGSERIITPLDSVDEEDLMFSNYTCFIKPSQQMFPVALNISGNVSPATLTEPSSTTTNNTNGSRASVNIRKATGKIKL